MSLLDIDPARVALFSRIVSLVVGVVVFLYVGIHVFDLHREQQAILDAYGSPDNSLFEAAVKKAALVSPETAFAGFVASIKNEDSLNRQIPENGRFIVVDAATGDIRMYEDGVLLRTLSDNESGLTVTGGSQTRGMFRVERKRERYHSPITKHELPYTIWFAANSVIHGPLEGVMSDDSEWTGGIELALDEAKVLYNFAAIGTPLFVESASSQQTGAENRHVAVHTEQLPATSAHSYVVGDVTTGAVFLERNSTDVLPIASITKLMTALVASEYFAPNDEVRMSEGEWFVVGDLSYPLFLQSDNDVAESIASHGKRSTFLAHMNITARSLGMQHTQFYDASGLSPRNVSTADDLFLFAQHLYDDERYLLDMSREQDMTIISRSGWEWHLRNQNKLSGDPHFLGGKLGYTDEAQQTSVALFAVPVDGEAHVIAVVVLGSEDWKQDTRTLVRWVSENVEANDTLAHTSALRDGGVLE